MDCILKTGHIHIRSIFGYGTERIWEIRIFKKCSFTGHSTENIIVIIYHLVESRPQFSVNTKIAGHHRVHSKEDVILVLFLALPGGLVMVA